MSSSKYRTSCDACLNAKVRCSQSKPSCGRCHQGGQPCKYSQYRRLGRPPKRLAPDVSSHLSKEPPRLRSQQTIETHTKEQPSHLGVMYRANIRPKTGVHCLKSDNVDTLGHLDAMSVPPLASAHDWSLEDVHATEEGLSGSFDLMPEFDFFDNLEVSVSDFLRPGPGFGLSPSTISPGRLSTEEIIDSRFPVETSTDHEDFSSPNSPAYGPHHLPLAATPGTTPGAQRLFRTPSTPDTRCRNQCYSSLMEQLSQLREVRSSSYTVPFDIILSHEEDVRRQREIILACPSCMGAPRSQQSTLLPMIMVFESLIRLFEWGGEGDRCCYYYPEHLDSACSDHMLGGGKEASPTPTSPGGVSRLQQQLQQQRDHCRHGPMFHMPQTSRPVLVGHFEVDEPAKAAFLGQLLRLHLDKHMVTVSELSERLSMDPENVNYKVSKDILADIRRRIEHFQGCLASAC